MDFGSALNYLQMGDKLDRVGWSGKNMYIALQRPDEHSKMTRPYLYMRTADDHLVPWLASQADILSTDWEVYRG